MAWGPLEEMKAAAKAYVDRQDLTRTRIAVVCFSSVSEIRAPLTRDRAVLGQAIDGLTEEGSTRIDLGLTTALQLLEGAPEKRNILLFTDGIPEADEPWIDAATLTLQASQSVQASRTRLLAIATGSADTDFLARLTGSLDLVFWATEGQFGEAFQQVEQVIEPPPVTHQLVDSAPVTGGSTQLALLRTSVWTGLLGLGVVVALLLAQKRYTRHVLVPGDLFAVVGGLLVGCAAGAVGQVFFEASSESAPLLASGRIIAWGLLGGGLGWGISLFIPNLPSRRATVGGAVGGALGAVGFLYAASTMGDLAARLSGAALVGFFIGLMVVLAEVASRKIWLHVSYGPADAFDVNLGPSPISIGSDRTQCRILAREVAPVVASYGLDNGAAFYEDGLSGQRTAVWPGHSRVFGNVSVTLQGDPQAQTSSSSLSASSNNGNLALRSNGQPSPEPLNPSAPLSTASYAPPIPAITHPATPSANGGAPAGRYLPHWNLMHPRAPIRLPQNDSQLTIGRDPQNQIILTDSSVSSHHAVLRVSCGLLTITDVGSTNGTFVNGYALNPHVPTVLQMGDRLRLGEQEYSIDAV
jgi:Ca-activated chloride channel family protein